MRPGAHSGPKWYLSDEEEQFVTFLVGSARMGYAKTKKEVIAIVEELLSRKGMFVWIYLMDGGTSHTHLEEC